MFGKLVSDLQEDIVVTDNGITGTLKYVTGYTGYSGDEELQEGNFVALKVESETGATVTVEVIGGSGNVVTLDSDMNLVVRLTGVGQALRFVTTVDGKTTSKVYALNNLTLAPKSED